MPRQTRLWLRHLVRRFAWLLASWVVFFFLLMGAIELLSALSEMASVTRFDHFVPMVVFFEIPGLFFSVFCWFKLVARFPSAEADWPGRMLAAGAIVGVGFVAPAVALGGMISGYSFQLLAHVALGAALVWGAFLLPRLVLPGLRGRAVARDVVELEMAPGGWGTAVARCGLLYVMLAIAIPNFLNFGRQPRWHEARLGLNAIRAAELSYFHEIGSYVAAGPHPAGPPGREKHAWRLAADHVVEGFDQLGWEPEPDQTLCQYAVAVETWEEGGARRTAFTAEAICDIDGDGESLAWGYVQPAAGASTGIPGPFGRCPVTGVIASNGQRRVETVGPCDTRSGRTVF